MQEGVSFYLKWAKKLYEAQNYMLFFSHYADSHRGVCIEYVIDASFFEGKRMFYAPVRYQETMKAESVEQLFAMKHAQWSYEREARIVAFGAEGLQAAAAPHGVEIKKIIFGFQTTEEDKALIYRLMKEKGIAFYEVQKPKIMNLAFELAPYAGANNDGAHA